MRVHVSFRTRRFKSSDPNCASPPCFGEDLTRWLVAQLRAETGLRFDDPLEEDYGWGFWGEGDYWISAGIMDESIGNDDAEWIVSVVYDPGLNLKKRLFGKPDGALQSRLIAAIHTALTSEPEITGVRWCADGERDCGDTPA
jgi:hypothetical protein